jgi:MFS transporter, SP family, xylose:H+ symportor
LCEVREKNPWFAYDIDFKVDKSYEFYLDNWYLEMDLMCTPAATIGLIITAYYIGYIIGGLFSGLPDKYGRKISLAFSLAISNLGLTIMLFSSSFTLRLISFGLLGLSQIKNVVSYVWLSECVPLPLKPRSYTLINIADALPMVIVCIYYLAISRDWIYINIVMTVVSYIAWFLIPFCPESPRWLLVNGRKAEAIEVLNYMAKANGSSYRIPITADFVEDPTNYTV